jgi:hypothetical protein
MAGGPTTAFGVAVDGLADRYDRVQVLSNAVVATQLGLAPTMLLATVEGAARDRSDLVAPAAAPAGGLPDLELAELAELCLRSGLTVEAETLLERALDRPETDEHRDLRARWAWLAVAALDASTVDGDTDGRDAGVELAFLRATSLCTDLEARVDDRRVAEDLAGAADGYYELAAAWDVAAHWEAGADHDGVVDPDFGATAPARLESAAQDLERSAAALEAAGECAWLRLEPAEALVAAGAALDRRASADYLRTLVAGPPAREASQTA